MPNIHQGAKHKPGGIIKYFHNRPTDGHYKVSGPTPLKLDDHIYNNIYKITKKSLICKL